MVLVSVSLRPISCPLGFSNICKLLHLPNDILALQQAPGLSENDAASIDHLPGLKSLKMRVRHWGTAPM